MRKNTVLFSTYLLIMTVRCESNDSVADYTKFPEGFRLGVSSSSYQIEGAWNVSDKSANIWDRYTQEGTPVVDGSNGDIACDSYNKYKEDVALLRDLGVDSYRLSLSWARILPSGFPDKVSKDGIEYYKNLLDDLIAVGIEPMVTIYHWDHPVVLEDMGGWTNDRMVTWFVDYARIVLNELGERVKIFVTINEPEHYCNFAHGNRQTPPGPNKPAISPYICVHNMLKAHAKVYHMYDKEFRPRQRGVIGMVVSCVHHYPLYEHDSESAEAGFDFECGWVADPIYSEKGDYPESMRKRIGENSLLEGFPRSRLPVFSQAEIDDIRGTADFFGLNYYTSDLVESAPKSNNTPWYRDAGVIHSFNASWPTTASSWLKIVPQGFGDMLRKIKDRYNDPSVLVLENGVSDDGTKLNDAQRIEYLHGHLRELLLAINRDGCNVLGYYVWSFLDSFEWQRGYKERFGLVSVDFELPDRPRKPKLSYSWYKKLIKNRELLPIDAVPYSVD